MKKILVVFTGPLGLGGIEKSLLGLLDSIDYSKYEADLFLYAHHGELYPYINPHTVLLPEIKDLSFLRESLGDKIRHGCWFSASIRVRDEIRRMFSADKSIHFDRSWKLVTDRCVPMLEKEYDLALGFFRPFDIIKDKVRAKVRVGWVHTDYSSCEKDKRAEIREDYRGLDWIAAVSRPCADSFKSVFPELSNRVIVIENILSQDLILSQSLKEDVGGEMPDDGAVRLLSIGRFCHAKNFDNVPDICARIRRLGINVKWYLLGFGGDEEKIRKAIDAAGMKDHVIILGKKENPYPYIRKCDFYIQPSRYEGKCVAVREAQMLGKPVVITAYPTSAGQVDDGKDGIIVPLDNEGCAKGIAGFIADADRQKKILETMRNRNYANADAIEAICGLMGE